MKLYTDFLNEAIKSDLSNLPDIYKTLAKNTSFPFKSRDIEIIYNNVYKLYFKEWSALKRIDISFKVTQGINSFGKAVFKDEKYKIFVSKRILNDIKLSIDVIAHEAIHIWQFFMNTTNRTNMYTSGVGKGHGEFFLRHMNNMNKDGLNVSVRGLQDDIDLDDTYYGVAFLDNDAIASLVYTRTKLNKKDVSAIANDISNIYTKFTSVVLFTTTSGDILDFIPLSKSKKIKSNVTRILFIKHIIEKIIKTGKTIDKWKMTDFVDDLDVDTARIFNVSKSTNKFRGRSLKEFISLYQHNMTFQLTVEHEAIIEGFWKDVSDIELRRDTTITRLSTRIFKHVNITGALPSDIIADIHDVYNNQVVGRRTFNSFKDLLYKSIIAIDKTENKFVTRSSIEVKDDLAIFKRELGNV